MLQDRLEDYIDVSIGNAKMIDPSFLVEERVDCLIVGDVIGDLTPNKEIQTWLLQYLEVSKQQNYQDIKIMSGFYVSKADIKIEPLWIKFLHKNVEQKIIYPPVLRLMLNKGEVALENRAYDNVKDYSNDLIDFIVENKKK